MGCSASKGDTFDWNTLYETALTSKMGAAMERSGSQARRLTHNFDPAQQSIINRAAEQERASVAKDGMEIKKVNGYEVKASLGKGAFGEVFLGKKDGGTFAIKVLRKSALKRQRTGKTGSALDSVKYEIATMKKIAHPNCVHMFDVILDPTHDEIYLVLEFVEGGCSQKNDKEGKPIPLAERAIWSHMRHLVLGLEYLHMHAIVHRDIKPDNLLLSRTRSFEGCGMLKICDFGTSSLCEGSEGQGKSVGTPPFFSPELCSREQSGTYDNRVLDLWAVGVTMYLWCCGRLPYQGGSVMLLMEAIKNAEPVTKAPHEASPALAAVIEGLLTADPAKRLTLVKLRSHKWLTDNDRQVLPPQPVMHVEVTPEEIEQAFSNRAAMMAQSAAGPSHLGQATGYIANWKREGLSVMRKLCSIGEAEFYQAIGDCGHLAPHIPAIYSVRNVRATVAEASEAGPVSFRRGKSGLSLATQKTSSLLRQKTTVEASAAAPAASDEADEIDPSEEYEVRMQDLASGMTWPCAMAIAIGVRTTLPVDFEEFSLQDRKPELLENMLRYDPSGVTEEEKAAGGVNLLRYLTFLDEHSSTKEHGFRIDAARTIVDGEIGDLPLPEGVHLETLRDEARVCGAFAAFLQHDVELAKAVVVKIETLITALQRSDFVAKHALLRSSLLLFYDDASRLDKLELKMINFGFSYHLPEGQTTDHTQPWDGTPGCHEDGYMTGVRSLHRVMQKTCELLQTEPKTFYV